MMRLMLAGSVFMALVGAGVLVAHNSAGHVAKVSTPGGELVTARPGETIVIEGMQFSRIPGIELRHVGSSRLESVLGRVDSAGVAEFEVPRVAPGLWDVYVDPINRVQMLAGQLRVLPGAGGVIQSNADVLPTPRPPTEERPPSRWSAWFGVEPTVRRPVSSGFLGESAAFALPMPNSGHSHKVITSLADLLPAEYEYVALGDSITYGFGAAEGFVRVLAQEVAAARDIYVDVHNFGIPQQTSTDLLKQIRTNQLVQQELAKADLVTLNIGGNDFLEARARYKQGACGGVNNQDCLKETVLQYQRNLNFIAIEVTERVPRDTSLVALDLYYPFVVEDRADGDWTVLKRYWSQINSIIHRELQPEGFKVADVATAFNGPHSEADPKESGLLAADGVHPSAAGHALIAELLQSRVQ